MKNNPEAKALILEYFTPAQEIELRKKVLSIVDLIYEDFIGLIDKQYIASYLGIVICETLKYHKECQKEMVVKE